MRAHFDELHRFVLRVRRRLLLQAAASAFLVAIIAVGAVAAFGVAASMVTDAFGWVRSVTLGTGVAVTLAAVVGGLAAALRRYRSPLAVARTIERSADGLRSGLVSALEFRTQLARVSDDDRISLDLLTAMAERTRSRVGALDIAALFPARRPMALAAVLAVLLFGLSVAGLLHRDELMSGANTLLAGPPPPPARAAPLGPVGVPVLVSDLTVAYRYPDHTALADRTERNASGDMRAITGTRIELATRTLMPARAAELVFDSRPDEPVLLAVEGDGTLTGGFVLRETDAYRFRLEQPDGTVLQETTARRVEAVPDTPPTVRLLVPEHDLEVNADDRIELLFEASDDFGVDSVALAYEREGHDTLPVRRRIGDGMALPEGQGRTSLDLHTLELRPGERVVVWIEATDNDSVTGPKTGRSEHRSIRVYSPEEKHTALLREERALFEKLLLILADRLVLARPDDVPQTEPEAGLAGTTAAVNATRLALETFESLLERMGNDPLTPEDVLRDFSEVHSRLLAVLDEETVLLRATLVLEGNKRHAPARQRALAQRNADTVVEMERAVLLVDRLVDRQHQERVLSDGRDFVRQTERLLDMLSQLEKGGDEAIKLRMARELERMRSNLERMNRDLRRQAKDLPYDRFNASALGDRGTMSSIRSYDQELEEIKQLLKENRLEEARQRLEQLARSSQEMMASLEGDFAERGSQRLARTARRVRRARKRLNGVVAQQQKIHEATGEHEETFNRRVRKKLADRLDNLARREEDRIARVEKVLKMVDRDVLHESDAKGLNQRLAELQDIRRLLRAGDVGEASKVADRVERSIEALRQEVAQGAMFEGDRGRKQALRKAARRLGQAQPYAEDLSESLRSLIPDGETLLSKREQAQMRRVGRQQGNLRERLQRVRRGMEALRDDQPGLHGQLDRVLGEAEKSMEKAGEEMGQYNPGLSEEHQRSALEKLAEAGRQLDRAARPQEKDRQDGAPGVGEHRLPVEIPQADDYRAPAEFREQLIEAMKEDAPILYRELVEKYYESLIR